MTTPIERACELAGGQSALAALAEVTPQAVYKWRRKGQIPVSRVPQIAEALGYAMSYHELRPDVFPREAKRGRGH